MPYQRREFPEWSWSQTRAINFRDCQRSYFHRYYGAHNGWETGAMEYSRKAFQLKHMINLHLLVGDIIHQLAMMAIHDLREDRGLQTAQFYTELGRQKLNEGYLTAKKRVNWERSPSKNKMLHEFYYSTGPSPELIDTIKKKLFDCIKYLLTSKTFSRLQSGQCEIFLVDVLANFQLHNTKLYAAPDLLYREQGQIVLVDWKTGSTADEYKQQIMTYALYTQDFFKTQKFEIKWPIKGRLQYLLNGTLDEFDIFPEDLEKESLRIAHSIQSMREFLVEPEANQPESMKQFKLTEKTWLCKNCSFFELCEPELSAK